nr:T9SS type A sorting domain-containing protein [Bacteroidota bacterium]
MTKQLTFLAMLLMMSISIFTQEVIVEWNFPDDSADSVADGGIATNLDKIITTRGGTSALDYKNGATTKAAQATGWDNGSEQKCWQISLSTEVYGSLKLSSKITSGGNDPGPRDFRVDYKIGNDGVWTEVPNSDFQTANDWETGILENLALPEECSNRPLVMLRWIMTSDTSTAGILVEPGGKLKIDDIVISGTDISSVSKDEFATVRIYPNPFTDFISFGNLGEITSCRIFNMNGQLVHNVVITESQQLDLRNLISGLYSMQLSDIDGTFKHGTKLLKR